MKKEPIAVVGLACRFPGDCNTPEEFWNLLVNGVDAITELKNDRWSTDHFWHPDRNAPGKTYARHAGQLTNAFQFDPEFFGISPREAVQMDPQQRLLLEMTWEALEYGNQIPDQLAGSNCSVYIGISSLDYANSRFDDPALADSYFMTGNTLSIAANRISHLFDFRGPSMALDTACSSSLVALHQACSSIWSGESQMSVAGAVHLLLTPFPFIGFAKASMLSPDGRCKVFDTRANGYVRSEGGAIFILKPLSLAERAGDPIQAVIVATGVNTDGRKPTIVVPEARAQQDLLERVYTDAGIDPARILYVEAHGTGTPVGDPIEAQSISGGIATRGERLLPLLIGSVKSNIGHLETASGAAGLMKVILAIKHRAIPPSIHFETPNPNIDFDSLKLKVVNRHMTLSEIPGELLMGVNSFGFGGSNAHVIVAEYKDHEPQIVRPGIEGCPPLLLTAACHESLQARAVQFSELFKMVDGVGDVYDISYSVAKYRQKLKHRLIVWGDNAQEIAGELNKFATGEPCAQLITTEGLQDPIRIAFVFSGNGSQWAGMGKDLMLDGVFRDAVAGIDEYFQPLSGWSLAEKLSSSIDPDCMEATEIAQPTLFAIQAGIVAIMQSRGVTPDAVCGHSVGEIAAAWVAGAIDLEQAVNIIYFRSMAQAETKGLGKMAAAQLAPDRARLLIEKISDGLEIAAMNSPRSVSFSGPAATIMRINSQLREEGTLCRVLDLDYAFHSSVMESVKDSFLSRIGMIKPSTGVMPFISTVTGNTIPGSELDQNYWWENLRKTVQFSDAFTWLIENKFNLFMEIGPHPVLKTYLHEGLAERQIKATVLSTLRRKTDQERELLERSIHEIILHAPNRHMPHYFKTAGQRVSLPSYPWNAAEFRITKTNEAYNYFSDHPLLGFKLNSVGWTWQNQIDTVKHPLLADHKVDEVVVFPASAYVEMALAVSARFFSRQQYEIYNLEIRRPLLLDEEQIRDVQIAIAPDELDFEIRSRPRFSDQSWSVNAVGKLAGNYTGYVDQSALDISQLKSNASRLVVKEEIYEIARTLGLEYGPAFQGLDCIWVCGNKQLLARYDTAFITGAKDERFIIHPAILDSAFHTLFPALNLTDSVDGKATSAYLPLGFENIRIEQHTRNVTYSLCEILSYSPNSVHARITLLDEAGHKIAGIDNCFFKKLPRARELDGPDFYHFVQIPRNHIDAFLPVPSPGMDDLKEYIKAHPVDENVLRNEKIQNEQVQPLYEALAIAIAEKTLREFGAHMGEFTVDSLITSSGIAECHKRFIYYLLRMLEEDGKAVCQDGVWKLQLTSDDGEALPIWRSIIADYPRYQPDMFFTSQYGFDLVNTLSRNPQDLDEQCSELKRYNFVSSGLNIHILKKILGYIVHEWPGNKRRLRIVEITDRERSCSRQLADLLPREFCDFQIITRDATLSKKAEFMFKDYPNIKIITFNLGDNSIRHDFQEGEFDILISSEWLHQCDDVIKTLDDFNYLLGSGGLLLLSERRPDRIIDINMGIDPAWWLRSMHDEYPVSRLMDADDWVVTIEKAGFNNVTIINNDIVEDNREVVISACRQVRNRLENATGVTRNTWLLIAHDHGLSKRIADSVSEELSAHGLQGIIACVDRDSKRTNGSSEIKRLKTPEDFRLLLASLGENNLPSTQIVYLCGLDLSINTSISSLIHTQSSCCMDLVNLLKATEVLAKEMSPRFWLISGNLNSHAADEGQKTMSLLNQAPLQGLGRVIRNEYPDIDCRQVVLNLGNNIRKNAHALWNEISQADDECEVILTRDARKVVRLDLYRESESDRSNGGKQARPLATVYRLAIKSPGNLDSLYWQEFKLPSPADDEIVVKVMASGLNFRDVMFASGLLPDEILENGFAGATLGMECAGVVTRCGRNVNNYKAGDHVIAFASACFASHVVTRTTAVTKKPDSWTWEESVTVPTTFFTVYYSLKQLAQLRAGEKILIHGAAGGVGLAAIQYANYCGAEIFATAGTPEKRRFLEYLGVDHVLDSRTLKFADEIMTITAGSGVDVVLNSLAGEAMERNFSVLKPFGRFIELGKRDFLENRKIGLRKMRNNISYFAVDADQLMHSQPLLAGKLFSEMMELFKQGCFRPLAHTITPASDIVTAFRTMQQSAHVGKLTVSMQSDPGRISRCDEDIYTFGIDDKASYLIAGGASGFGFATAKWLVNKGAKRIILLGRRAGLDENQLKYIDSLKSEGVEIQYKQCDVADPVALKKVLREINIPQNPLKGIIHAAMVLKDSAIRNLDEESFAKVFVPKIQGAWCLHQVTADLVLDFFILYSSATTCLGNPGQANYVAANTYLEALAQYRRSQGLPALAIAWDAIMDTGYLARDESLRDTFRKRLGVNGISSRQAFLALEKALSKSLQNPILMNANWVAMKRLLPIMTVPMYTNVLHGIYDDMNKDSMVGIQELIQGLSREEVHVLISGMLGDEVARILQLPREKVEHNRPLQELGIDSLMAMELVAAIEKRFNVEIPIMALSDSITVDTLAARLVKMILNDTRDSENLNSDAMLIKSMAEVHAETIPESALNEFTTNFEKQADTYRRIIQ
jgi:acyl transferase domain-containing protein/NADPH:quinone reductase-like Zn-dependent oxidoreductase/NAD(P)-dependent dehydrogenase (short-subunit alcohol dehydrogenase family)/acyl carrier protein